MKKRIHCLSKIIKAKGLEGFLTSDSADIQYLTAEKNLQGWALFTASQEIIYFLNPISAQKIKAATSTRVIKSFNTLSEKIAKEAKKLKLKKIGFSESDITYQTFHKIKESLSKENIAFSPTKSLIAQQRKIKDSKEIKLIKKAALYSSETFEYIQEIFNQQMSEKSLGVEIERFLRLRADDEIAFPPVVASGKNTFYAHHSPGEDKIKNFFLVDLGAKYHGYCADLTRVFFWGKMPSLFGKIYKTVKKAQIVAINKIKEGKKASEIDRAGRDVIEKQGFGKYFCHGLGHGVGLEVHELPYLNPNSDETLKEGMVLTIEPGVYYKNLFGIRLESMVIVKSNGGEVIA